MKNKEFMKRHFRQHIAIKWLWEQGSRRDNMNDRIYALN